MVVDWLAMLKIKCVLRRLSMMSGVRMKRGCQKKTNCLLAIVAGIHQDAIILHTPRDGYSCTVRPLINHKPGRLSASATTSDQARRCVKFSRVNFNFTQNYSPVQRGDTFLNPCGSDDGHPDDGWLVAISYPFGDVRYK